MHGGEGDIFTSSNLILSGSVDHQRMMGHLLFLGVKTTIVTLLFLDASVSAEDRPTLLSLVIVGPSSSSGCCVGTLLDTLSRSCVGVFGATLALGGRGSGLGSSRVVVSITIRVRLDGGALLGSTFLGRLGAGSFLSVGVTTFSISRFSLDSFATLLRSCFSRSSFIVILGVSVGGSFAFGFLRRGSRSSSVDSSATNKLFLDN